MHSRFYHEAELTCVLSVGPHTHVRAEGYGHASLVRAGEGLLDLHADDDRLLDLRWRQQAVALCHLQNRDASMTISRFDRTVPGLVQKALSEPGLLRVHAPTCARAPAARQTATDQNRMGD